MIINTNITNTANNNPTTWKKGEIRSQSTITWKKGISPSKIIANATSLFNSSQVLSLTSNIKIPHSLSVIKTSDYSPTFSSLLNNTATQTIEHEIKDEPAINDKKDKKNDLNVVSKNVMSTLKKFGSFTFHRASKLYDHLVDSISSFEEQAKNLSDESVENKEFHSPAAEERGKVIEASFKDNDGNVIAIETAHRIDTVDMLRAEYRSKITYLQKKLDKTSHHKENDRKKIEQAIQHQEQLLQNIDDQLGKPEDPRASKWASTNMPRHAFNIMGIENAKKNYIPLLGNMRYQSVITPNGTKISGVTRSAALTDFSVGETNLTEMEDHLLMRKIAMGSITVDKETLERLNVFYHIGTVQNDKTIAIDNDKLKAAIAETATHIKQGYPDLETYDDNDSQLPEKEALQRKIQERTERLDSLFLQELKTRHLGMGSVQGDTFNMSRLSLLNTRKKRETDKSGLVLDEKNQSLDTAATYNRHNGKILVYDLEGEGVDGFIDHDANEIHLPKKWKMDAKGNENNKSVLNTMFSNISTQISHRNTDEQAFINKKALKTAADWIKKLESEKSNDPEIQSRLTHARQLYNTLSKDFKAGKGGPKRAEMMAEMMTLIGDCAFSCYGGKDRTAYIVAFLTYKTLEKLITPLDATKEKVNEMTSMLARFGRELVSQNSVAVNIIKDNTGHKAFKLISFNLRLYMNGNKVDYMLGIANRLFDYGLYLSSYLPGEKGTGIAFENSSKVNDEVKKKRFYSTIIQENTQKHNKKPRATTL